MIEHERFTDRTRKVFQLADQEAQRFNHNHIGTEHILLGIVKEKSNIAAQILQSLDVDLRKVRLEVEKQIQSGPDRILSPLKLPFTYAVESMCRHALDEAKSMGHEYIGTEHLLLAIISEYSRDCMASIILEGLGVSSEKIRTNCMALLGQEKNSMKKYDDLRNKIIKILLADMASNASSVFTINSIKECLKDECDSNS